MQKQKNAIRFHSLFIKRTIKTHLIDISNVIIENVWKLNHLAKENYFNPSRQAP